MKLILNERQYKLIESLISEDNYQELVKGVDEGKEIVLIDKNGNKLSFNVLLNDNGQLYLHTSDNNIYKNDLFFITITDLSNDNLSFRRVNIPDELRSEDDKFSVLKEIIKTTPVKDWKKSTFKGIKSMKIGDTLVDIEKSDDKTEELKKYKQVDDIKELLSELNSFSEGDVVRFDFVNGGNILFNVNSKESNSYFLEFISSSGDGDRYKRVLANHDIILEVSENNIKQYISSLDDEEDVNTFFNIRLKKSLGGATKKGGVKSELILVKYISDFEKVTTKKDKPKKKDLTPKDIDDMTDEDITNLVLSNPNFRNAFAKKPSFWDVFLEKEPKGIFAAKAILRNIVSSKSLNKSSKKESVGDKFKNNQIYLIQLIDKDFNHHGVELKRYEEYRVKANKRTKMSGESIIILTSKQVNFKVNKLEEGTSNRFKVTVMVKDKDGNTIYTENRTAIIKESY